MKSSANFEIASISWKLWKFWYGIESFTARCSSLQPKKLPQKTEHCRMLSSWIKSINDGTEIVLLCSAMLCIKGSSRALLVSSKESRDRTFSPFFFLLPSPPAAADDGHNKNSSSDLVQVVAFFLAEAKGFHQDWRVLWIGYTTCPKCESILDMTKAKCGWLSPAGRGIIKSLPTLILFNLISYPEINQNQSNQCTLSLFIALFVPKYGSDPEFQSKKICK